jgi:hypothetical protein
LEQELAEYAATVEGDILFPTPLGKFGERSGRPMRRLLLRAREASGIQDLTFRQCRTTLATLWEGDLADLQATLGHPVWI